MDFGENEIAQLVESVWTSVLGWEACPSAEALPSAAYLTGSVTIQGSWTGRVLLHGPPEFVGEAAASMFGLPPGELTPEQMHDALGELTNIVGGNLKALFGGVCCLGLPEVTTAGVEPSGPSLLRVPFESRGLAFVVELRADSPAPREVARAG